MKTVALGMALALGALGTWAAAPQAQQKKEQPAKTVVDPSCGMTIDPAKAAGKSEYKGTTYYFCSDHCKRTFDADPEGTLKKAAARKK